MTSYDTENLATVMEAIFNPASIAVVGVPEGMKMGRLFLMGLQSAGYRGKIYPVNPRIDTIDGLPVFRHVTDIPGPVDLAIVLVPQKHLFPVIEELGAIGTKAAVIFAAGFSELGADGMEQQRELVAHARSNGVRLIGPNCMGVYSSGALVSSFPSMPMDEGDTALVSGSGSLTSFIVLRGVARGLPFGKAVSFGNAADLAPSDFFSYLAQDPKTAVITAYIEGAPEGRRFFETVNSVARVKPVVIWKAGLTGYGRNAARSHTGALAGDGSLWEGALTQAGAVQVSGMDELLDAVMALKFIPPETGNRVAILSGPGGFAVAAADELERSGLTLAELTPETRQRIASVLPNTGISVVNPVDVGLSASVDFRLYTEPARIVMEDPNVDALLIIGGTFSAETNRNFMEELVAAKRATGKALIMVDIPEFYFALAEKDLGKHFLAAHIPTFPSSARALWALKKAVDYGRFLRGRSNG
jgi:acyl-CoA synthetase (NDP forming)